MNSDNALNFIVNAKQAYRAESRSLSWEEKVATIEMMREAAQVARQSMRMTLEQHGADQEQQASTKR